MLNGVAPIFLFSFFKIPLPAGLSSALGSVPLLGSSLVDLVSSPPIPLYLDEKLTGIFLEAESKNLDLVTDIEAVTDPKATKAIDTYQRPINSSVTLQMIGKKDSVGITILSAMLDVIFPKIATREYSISYLHGAITVFGGQLNSYAIEQNPNDNLIRITVNLARTNLSTKPASLIPEVGRITGGLPA